jgi:type II secretory pathway pseudopilin PulG
LHRMKPSQGRTAGFSIIDMVVVMMLIGVAVAIAMPRGIKRTPRQELNSATRQLLHNLELARTRAIAKKRPVRMRFDISKGFYTAFIDISEARSGVIAETADEARDTRLVFTAREAGIPGIELPESVEFGYGDATVSPLGEPIAGTIELEDDRVEFNGRGMVVPLGNGGTIYLTHKDHPSLVSAISISGTGAVRSWRFNEDDWE